MRVVGLALLLGACGSQGGSTADSPSSSSLREPVTVATQPPAETTAAPTTVAPRPTTTAASTPTTPTTETPVETSPPITGPCTFDPPTAGGEITHIESGRLLGKDGDATERCLEEGLTTNAPVQWSATGDRFLTADNVITGSQGGEPSGVAATDTDVSWSAPTGKALISIDPASQHLIWHSNATGETKDISFLARTDEAVYHPAGKGIAAVGMAEDGTYGIWLASNRGSDRQLITRIDDPTTPASHLSFSADGRALFFIHRAVHSLVLDGLYLTELGAEGRQEDNLVVSNVDMAWANTTGACDTSGSVIANGADLRAEPGSPFADRTQTLQPVGWLAGARLIVAVRPTGCEGPADVWMWTGSGAQHEFTKVGHGWNAISVRTPHGPFVDLPDQIEQAAPG